MFKLRKLGNKALLSVIIVALLSSMTLTANNELTEIFEKYETSIENKVSETLESNNDYVESIANTVNKKTVIISVLLAMVLPYLFNKMIIKFKVKKKLSRFKDYTLFKWYFLNE